MVDRREVGSATFVELDQENEAVRMVLALQQLASAVVARLWTAAKLISFSKINSPILRSASRCLRSSSLVARFPFRDFLAGVQGLVSPASPAVSLDPNLPAYLFEFLALQEADHHVDLPVRRPRAVRPEVSPPLSFTASRAMMSPRYPVSNEPGSARL